MSKKYVGIDPKEVVSVNPEELFVVSSNASNEKLVVAVDAEQSIDWAHKHLHEHT